MRPRQLQFADDAAGILETIGSITPYRRGRHGHRLIRFLHWLVAKARVYDAIQRSVGIPRLDENLKFRIGSLGSARVMIDVGGGTGRAASLAPEGCLYVCLDPDFPKINGFRRKSPDGVAVVGDGSRLPFQSSSVDLALFKFVAHHVPDPFFPAMLAEIGRVLTPRGHLIFIEPNRSNDTLLGKIERVLDPGRYSRTDSELRSNIAAQFDIVEWDHFQLLQEMIVCVARPKVREGVAA